MKSRIFVTVVVCLVITGMALAQGTGASGSIRGTITDPSGAAVPKATITVVQPDKGIHRTATIGDAGQYSVLNLPPDTYTVTAEMAGFQTITYKTVVVNVGQQVVLDIKLALATVKNEVNVTTEVPLVEVAKTSQSDTLTQAQIDNLPINKRDYLTFTQLTPGVSDSTHLVDNQDFRVKQTPQSNISIYGSNGRGNSITVDGGEFNDDAGGVRLNVSQDAVQEFQINRSNYNPELGSASGASINIVTRSGTNNVHGTVFGFFRNDALDAQDPFSLSSALPVTDLNPAADPNFYKSVSHPVNADLSRQQFGASIGFPLVKDKTFAFFSYEGLRRDEDHSTVLLTDSSIFAPTSGQIAIINGLATLPGNPSVPCLTGAPALPAATCAAVLTNALSIKGTSAACCGRYLIDQFERNSGLFPFGQISHLGSARIDHRFSEKDNMFLRFGAGRDNNTDPNLTALTAFSRGETLDFMDITGTGSWFHILDANRQNEVRFQASYAHTNVTTNDAGGPGLEILGFGSFNRDIFLPDMTRMEREELADNFTWIKGRHTMKMGAYMLLRGDRSESHTFFAGRFVFGQLPGGILSPCLQVPAACGLTANPTGLDSLQSASFGLPLFYQQGFGDPTVQSTNPYFAGYFQDTWQARRNLSLTVGLRYEYDGRNEPLNTYPLNFAPRASFAWDPFSNQKTVVRGGYGVFYSPVYYQIDYVVKALGAFNGHRQIAQVFVPLTGVPGLPGTVNAASIFQTQFALGNVGCGDPSPNEACITPADLAPFGINITHDGAIPPLSVIFQGDPNFRDPYTQQFDLGIDHQFSGNFAVSASYIHALTVHLPQARDLNLLPTTPITTNFQNTGTDLQNWNVPQCKVLVGNPCFANPFILQQNAYLSAAAATYDGGLLELKYRPTQSLNVMFNYTYSKAIDNATDYNSDFAPFNQVSLAGERNVSPFDQRHKVVATAVWEPDYHSGKNADWAHKVFGDWSVAPIFRYNSGHPYNVLAGSDVNGDHHSTNDRVPTLSRDAGLGPDFFSWDMRLAKRIKTTERTNLQFTAEAFNLMNRTNYISINNVCNYVPSFTSTKGIQGCQTVGNLNPALVPLALQGTNSMGPSQPEAFTSADSKRQIQLGLRFNW